MAGRLILSRLSRQSFWIGANCEIAVVSVVHGKVRLSVVAPKSINVRRSELLPQEASDAFAPLEAAIRDGAGQDDLLALLGKLREEVIS